MAAPEALSDAELARFRALAERPLEDQRGVDLTQVRDRLRLTPAERVAKLVHEVEMYRQIRESVRATIGDGIVIRVASLQTVIDSKRAADRPKDHRALPYLESLLEEIQRND